jgi:hypothetical protein
MTAMIALKQAWAAWKRFAFWLGEKQATLIYTVLYFVLIGPIAIVRRFTADPLQARARGKASFWLPRVQPPATLADARRQ